MGDTGCVYGCSYLHAVLPISRTNDTGFWNRVSTCTCTPHVGDVGDVGDVGSYSIPSDLEILRLRLQRLQDLASQTGIPLSSNANTRDNRAEPPPPAAKFPAFLSFFPRLNFHHSPPHTSPSLHPPSSPPESPAMEIAKSLVKCVARAFYDTKHILVVDALMIHNAYVLPACWLANEQVLCSRADERRLLQTS